MTEVLLPFLDTVHFGLSFWSFFGTSIFFATHMPSGLQQMRVHSRSQWAFIWLVHRSTSQGQTLFQSRETAHLSREERCSRSPRVGWLETQQEQEPTSSGSYDLKMPSWCFSFIFSFSYDLTLEGQVWLSWFMSKQCRESDKCISGRNMFN